ncbi:hypothetical protein EYF80_005546 [Liparis tanakae]|uniref:Uncharacterized protein n=1 Tax=Liparis tanakae TaxID=230148 RepID=A0A4Z2J1W0_9TELE|nr:hypothetical protein EYF80_005546 [Liparis tanakae]
MTQIPWIAGADETLQEPVTTAVLQPYADLYLKPRKKRMSGSWEGEEQDADEVQFKETDEVTACRRNDHRLRAARFQTFILGLFPM